MLKFYYENFLFVRTDYMLLLNGLQDTHYKVHCSAAGHLLRQQPVKLCILQYALYVMLRHFPSSVGHLPRLKHI